MSLFYFVFHLFSFSLGSVVRFTSPNQWPFKEGFSIKHSHVLKFSKGLSVGWDQPPSLQHNATLKLSNCHGLLSSSRHSFSLVLGSLHHVGIPKACLYYYALPFTLSLLSASFNSPCLIRSFVFFCYDLWLCPAPSFPRPSASGLPTFKFTVNTLLNYLTLYITEFFSRTLSSHFEVRLNTQKLL